MANVRDYTGKRFGYLTALEVVGKNKYNINLWKCLCDCGNIKEVPTNFLSIGSTKSCGCKQYKTGPRRDLSGDVYGNFTVLKYEYTKESNSMAYYLCQCSCGTQKVVSHGNLRSGHSNSCGCLAPRGKDHHNYQHGKSKTKVHTAWCKIKDRCLNPNNTDYHNYGGAGITISEVFLEDFDLFYKEIGDAPSSKHSVDRIDHTKNYEPGNIRWATDKQQARNKGMNKNNSSGETGVNFYHSGNPNHSTYAVAQWKDIDGKPQNKKFSVKKFGLIPAFKAAVEYRRKMIEELNAQGAGYTENHGK